MIDKTIRTALAPLGLPIEPNDYEGEEREYISYVYQELGVIYAEGRPHAIRYLVSVHWYLPRGENPERGKNRIRQMLLAAGATWPDIINASKKEGQHYAFDCEMVGEVPSDGELQS